MSIVCVAAILLFVGGLGTFCGVLLKSVKTSRTPKAKECKTKGPGSGGGAWGV